MDTLRDFIQALFGLDHLTLLSVLGIAFSFILGVIITEYRVKEWFYHKRVWTRLAVCIVLLMISVYFSCHVTAIGVFVVLVCLNIFYPLPHEQMVLLYCKKHPKGLENDRLRCWIVSTSALLRYGRLKIKHTEGDVRLFVQTAFLDEAKKWDLFDYEYKRYYLPNLDVLFKIGAVKAFEEECAVLSRFDNTGYMKTYKAYLAYNEKEYEKMSQVNDSTDDDVDARLVTLLNNLCAYETSGEKEKMRDIIGELIKFKENGIVHSVMYHDLMHYYDEIVQDERKGDVLAEEIEKMELPNFNDYLQFMDVAFMHYRRIGNQTKRNALAEKIIVRNEQMQRGESKLITRIRLLYVVMDNDANWQEYSIRLFQDRLTYLDYNTRVGAEYIKEVSRFLRDLVMMRGVQLKKQMLDGIMADFCRYASQYVEDLDAEIAHMDSRFLYKKKYYLLLKLEMLKFLAKDDIVMMRRNNDEIYDRITAMCEYNGNHREYLHFLVVHADDILTIDRQLMECTSVDSSFANSQNIKNYMKHRVGYVNAAENIVCKIVSNLEIRDYDQSLAYYVIYTSYFYMLFGNKKRSMYFFSKFERYGIDVRNWTKPVQMLYSDVNEYLS